MKGKTSATLASASVAAILIAGCASVEVECTAKTKINSIVNPQLAALTNRANLQAANNGQQNIFFQVNDIDYQAIAQQLSSGEDVSNAFTTVTVTNGAVANSSGTVLLQASANGAVIASLPATYTVHANSLAFADPVAVKNWLLAQQGSSPASVALAVPDLAIAANDIGTVSIEMDAMFKKTSIGSAKTSYYQDHKPANCPKCLIN